MNDNDELIKGVGLSSSDPTNQDDDDDGNSSSSSGSSIDQAQLTMSSLGPIARSVSKLNLPAYDDDDKCSPSGQSTIYSLDSATKELLFGCAHLGSAQCSMSSCGACEACQAKCDTRSRTITISRLTYNMREFDASFREEIESVHRHKRSWCQMPRKPAPNFLLAFLIRYIPFFDWIRTYNWSEDINSDVLAGITIAVFQIPQCMGYSLLANVPPIYGLYSSFMAPLFYTLLGTSRHNSVGTFAIISLMTGSVISELSKSPSYVPGQSEIEIATIIAFLIGLYQILFAFLGLGFLAQFMSEQLTSGFICASAVYVLSSQLGYVTGIKSVTAGSGPFSLIQYYSDLVPKLRTEANMIEVSISVVCIILLGIWKFYLLGLCQRSRKTSVRCLANLPSELLLVVSFIIASWFFDLEERFHVSILGSIPVGLPSFTDLDYTRIWRDNLWQSCIPLAIVAFAVTYSTGVTFGAKHGYEVVPNQELLAVGVTNTVCAYFQCIPTAASLSRSALQEAVGAKSQIASIVNSFVILIVLLFLSPLLCYLPKCVLASIICVALKSLFLKATDFKKYYLLDRIDGSIWIVSFLAVIVFNVDLGLYIGLAYSLLTLIAKSQRPKTYMLGVVGATNVYVPLVHYPKARQLHNIKIYQFCGPLHFANVNYFKRKLAEKTKMKRKYSSGESSPFAIIIDCSMFSYIDATGITALRNIVAQYEKRGVRVWLADVAAHVRTMMAADRDFHQEVPTSKIYITIHDAVHRAIEEMKLREMDGKLDVDTDVGVAQAGVDDDSPKSGTPENPFLSIEMDNEVREEVTPKVKKKTAEEEQLLGDRVEEV